jgi:HD-GYP domain-containing protein (c-di-GMP phosphodiesterase class II)/DNA-binding LacI/PurR family transcriptional regulator
MKTKNLRPRKTIGVLIDWTVDPYQQIFLAGIMDLAAQKGVHCIVFEGGGVGSPYGYETQRNEIYRLATDSVVDGLVVLGASIAHFAGTEETKAFCEHYRPLPLVTVSMEAEGATPVLVDNRPGMRELLLHLIERHRFKRFGYVKGRIGNQDAADRFRVFQDVLDEFRIPIDPRFILQGDFTFQSGIEAAREVMRRGVSDIEVLVTSNDNMAVGAMQEFIRRGVRIPGQIAVTGFDDIDYGDYLSPPLTTVRLPIYEQGWTAAKILLEKLEGREVPAKAYVPTKLVIRESCKCASGMAIKKEPPRKNHASAAQPAKNEREAVLNRVRELTRALLERRTDVDPEKAALELDQAYWKGRSPGDPKEFLAAFQESVYRPISQSVDYFTFRKMLLELWNRRSRSSPRNLHAAAVEDLYFQALSQMGQKIVEKESDRLTELMQESHKLEVIRDLLFTLNLPRQMDVLARRIPDMGIDTCYVSLHKPDDPDGERKAVCWMEVRGRKRIPVGPKGIEYPTKYLVPDDFFADHRQHMVIVEAMKEFGYIVFETGVKPNRFYAYLSDIISGAVQGALVFQAMEDQKNDLDRELEKTRKALSGSLAAMAAAVETREPYLAGHQQRVSELAWAVAREMGLSDEQVDGVRVAGAVHDLGKIHIPADILNKAGPLDDAEWETVRKHPGIAWEILRNFEFPWPIAEIVHQHHERVNGKGYPNGLKGRAVCLEARILGVADAVEAMVSRRPHREALGLDTALEELGKARGILYDPRVVDVCIELFRQKGFAFRTAIIPAPPARIS